MNLSQLQWKGHGAGRSICCRPASVDELVEGGINATDGSVFMQDSGHSDWGRRAGSTGSVQVLGVSPCTPLNTHGAGCYPFILKIDVDGGANLICFKSHLARHLAPMQAPVAVPAAVAAPEAGPLALPA